LIETSAVDANQSLGKRSANLGSSHGPTVPTVASLPQSNEDRLYGQESSVSQSDPLQTLIGRVTGHLSHGTGNLLVMFLVRMSAYMSTFFLAYARLLFAIGSVALAIGLFAGGHEATAQDSAGRCAPPGPWLEPGAKPGRPEIEFAACLREQAYDTRSLPVPVEAAATGIVAQCHIRVDRFEGATIAASETGSKQERQAADREALRQATAAINQYRQCVGR
jgi:hypothetical protein